MKRAVFNVAIKRHQAVNNATDADLEIHFLDYIYDTYDWWTGTETNMVKDLIEQVKAANPKKIKLVINSQGGDASIGLAIYNFLKNHKAEVETDIIGMAGSIASAMAFAADPGKVSMAKNAFVVIHRAWGMGAGNSEDLRAAADVIDMYTNQVVDIYSARTGKSKEEIHDLIANGDYWMTAEEAKALNFIDTIYNENEKFKVAAAIKTLDPNYKNIPESLRTNTNTIFDSLKEEVMNIKSLVSNFIAACKPKNDAADTHSTPPATQPANQQKPEAENPPAADTGDKGASTVANALEQPLTEFLTSLEKDLNTDVANAIANAKVFADLKKLVDDQAKEITELRNQIEKLSGAEGKETKHNKVESKFPTLAD